MDKLTVLSNLLRSGKICRRDFVLGATGLGISVSMASMAVDRVLAESGPKRGGTLRIGTYTGSTDDSLDPAKALHSTDFVLMYALYNNLVELDVNKQPIPELAVEWEANRDASEWTFKLRQGIEFHNGKSLDADDVRYSIGRHLSKDSKLAAKGFLKEIKEIVSIDKHTLKIILEGGNMDLPVLLTAYQLGIVPAGFSDWNRPIGTGGYTIERFNPGIGARLTRHPNYWKPDRAWVDAVELLVIHDGAARTTALKTGEVDVINGVEKRIAALLGKEPNIALVITPGGTYETAAMRCDRELFSDNNVRLALKYSFPREELLKTLFRGYGTLGNDHPIPPNDPFFNTELPQRVFDPDKARWHLKKANRESLSVALQTSTVAFAEAVDTAAMYRELAAQAGITIDVVRRPADGYWKNVWMKDDFVMSHWATRPTADMMFSTAFAGGASWNEAYWNNEQFNQLLIAARIERVVEKRKQMYWDMQEIGREHGGNIIFLFGAYIDAYSTKVKGARPDPARDLVGCRIAERVWLDL